MLRQWLDAHRDGDVSSNEMKTLLSFILLMTAALFCVVGQMKLEPLPLVLPKPLFEGTPVPPNVPNLEKPANRPRMPFLAPAGVSNVALRKLVTGSDSDPLPGI